LERFELEEAQKGLSAEEGFVPVDGRLVAEGEVELAPSSYFERFCEEEEEEDELSGGGMLVISEWARLPFAGCAMICSSSSDMSISISISSGPV